MLKAILCVALVSVLGAAECWAPETPGFSVCSRCEGEELKDSQCVRNGRWLRCYAEAAGCCKDSELSTHVGYETCMSNSGEDTKDASVCKKVVSRTASRNNDFCAEQCTALLSKGGNPKKDPNFNKECMYQHYEVVNGRTKVDDTCFEKWVYGYSEPNVNSSYKQGLTAETPAQCQLLCQNDAECVNWIWASEIYNESGGLDVKYRCALKNEKMVEAALEIRFTSDHPASLDTQYCNYGLPYQCLKGGFRCLPCGVDDVPVCVWESDMHITGWRHCVPTDHCEPNVAPLFSTESIATTPIQVPEESKATSKLEVTLVKTPAVEETMTEQTNVGTGTEIDLSTSAEVLATTAEAHCTEEGTTECHQHRPHRPHPCGAPCHCHGSECSPCCRKHSGVWIRIADRPKHLLLDIEN